jgi:proline iminopeptidase
MKKLMSKNKDTQYKWAKKWNVESKLFELMNFPKYYKKKKKKNFMKGKSKEDQITLAIYECYYYKNGAFFPKNYILNNAHKLKKIPGYIIHGRFDIICNPEGSWKLAQKWKKAKLRLTELAGHSYGDLNNTIALLEANNSCKKYYKNRHKYFTLP